MLHTVASPGLQAFLVQQTILDTVSPCWFQVTETEVTDLVLSETNGWEKEGERENNIKNNRYM